MDRSETKTREFLVKVDFAYFHANNIDIPELLDVLKEHNATIDKHEPRMEDFKALMGKIDDLPLDIAERIKVFNHELAQFISYVVENNNIVLVARAMYISLFFEEQSLIIAVRGVTPLDALAIANGQDIASPLLDYYESNIRGRIHAMSELIPYSLDTESPINDYILNIEDIPVFSKDRKVNLQNKATNSDEGQDVELDIISVLYELKTFEDVISFAHHVTKLGISTMGCKLYSLNKLFYIYFADEDCVDEDMPFEVILTEYGDLSNRTVEYLQEYGKELYATDTIEQIVSVFRQL